MSRSPALSACALLAVLTTSNVFAGWDDGVAAFRAGRYDEAAAAFASFVERSPEAPDGHYMLGLSLLKQKRGAEAVASLGRAVELGEGDARFSLALAQAQLKAGDGDGALATLAALDPAAVPAPERAGFQQLLAGAATAASRNAEARVALRKALDADATSKGLWLALANVTRRLDLPEERFSALARAFEIEPADAEPGRLATEAAIVIAQDEGDDVERRREWYRRASEVGGRLAAAFPAAEHLMLAGSAQMGAQQYEGAVASFEKVLAAGGDAALAHFYLGHSTLALGRPEQALGHLQEALERSPGPQREREIHAARGSAYRHLERFDRAAEAYRLAGDESTAAEMAGYAANRREWAAAKADCERKRDKIREIREGDDGLLAGTPAWEELQREMNEILAACAPYLGEGMG